MPGQGSGESAYDSEITRTIRHSNPKASMICFMPGMSLWLVLLIFLPRLTSGRLGPSKTNIGKNVVCMRVAQRKNNVRSTGFSPSRPYSAWKNQMLASMPRRNPRLPSGFASNPSLIASSVKDLVLAAGRRTLNQVLVNEPTSCKIKALLTSQRPATPILAA